MNRLDRRDVDDEYKRKHAKWEGDGIRVSKSGDAAREWRGVSARSLAAAWGRELCGHPIGWELGRIRRAHKNWAVICYERWS